MLHLISVYGSSLRKAGQAFALVLSVALGVCGPAFAAAPPIRVLPLGDSITDGAGATGGYRVWLYKLMTNAGYNLDLVGTQTDNGDPALPDPDHEGHSGWRIDQIDSIILGAFDQMPDPDVILLLIGTNDYGQGYDTANATNRLEALIAKMALARPYAKIIVANLLVRGEPYNTQIQTTFNPFVPGICARQRALGREVYFDDLRSAVPLSDMPDQLHPNATGYAKMATNWFGFITNQFSVNGSTNPPGLSHVVALANLSNVVVTFSKPVADNAATPTNFTLSGGAVVLGATFNSSTRREVTLATTPLATNVLYTLTVNGVSDFTDAARPIQPDSTATFYTYSSAGRGACNNVAEAGNYSLVYGLNIPNTPSYAGGVAYDLNLSQYAPKFTRVAYYLELQGVNGPVNFVWVSFDTLTTNVNAIGVPTVASGAVFQRPITNMNVFSSVTNLVTGTNLSGGNIEFWPGNYERANSGNIARASATIFDCGDNPTAGNYGSMQIHNHDVPQTLFAFNRWGGAGGTADLGVGNCPTSTDTDWTFAQNAGSYVVKTLQVFVLPKDNTRPPVLVSAAAQTANSVVLTFSKTLSEEATNLTYYSLSGGVGVLSAVLEPINKLSVTLDTTPLEPGRPYTVTINGVQDRTDSHLPVAPNTSASFITAGLARPGVFANVPEAVRWTMACSLDVPASSAYNTTNVLYAVDNRAGVADYTRIAYYLELATNGGPTNWIWVGMNSFTADGSRLGVPTTGNGIYFQQYVTNLTVLSSVPGIVCGTNLGGNIEIWPWDYTEANALGIPGASSSTGGFDWGDTASISAGGYGCLQIHNSSARQTLLAMNNFGGTGGGDICLGIGNNTTTAATDWTHVKNAASYVHRKLQVFVLPAPDTAAPTILGAVYAPDLRRITVTFSEPLADSAANLGNFSLNGADIIGAHLSTDLREVVLLTSLLDAATSYTLTVRGVRDRSSNANLLAPESAVAVTATTLPARLTANVPEASNYRLVYQLNIPTGGPGWNNAGTAYTSDNRASVGPFARVAYYLELATNGGPTNWIYVSMNAFTTNVNQIGVPDYTAGAVFQQRVTNLTVYSSVRGIATGSITNGNIEFWPYDYGTATTAVAPTGSGSTYDWNDTISYTFGTAGYGSMQVHDYGHTNVLFSYSHWGPSGLSCLGIGKSSGAHPDWTFSDNSAGYIHKALYVLVLPAVDTAGPRLVRAVGSQDRTHVVVIFNEPLDDRAVSATNFALSGGVAVDSATLRSNLREVMLTTSPQTAGALYTVTVSGVSDRSTNGNIIAPGSTVSFTSPDSPVFGRVPEAATFSLVYHLALPGPVPNYNVNGLTYNLDQRPLLTQPFNRIAYYLELAATVGGTTNWIYVSTEPFTTNLNRVGVPVLGLGAGFQQPLTNVNVRSSVAGIVTGDAISSGNIEAWPFNYANTSSGLVPTGSGSNFDWNDTYNTGGQYGCLQLHNWGANSTGQVLFAFNHWGGGQGGNTCLGIGTQPGSANMDWTFNENGSTYAVKNLYVLVQLTNPPPPVAVYAPPAIILQPVPRTNQIGDTATLAAMASGDGPFVWQWRWNGSPILDQTNSWLQFSSLQYSNSGNYDVVATGSGGATTSLVALLTVNRPPTPGDVVAGTAIDRPLVLDAAQLLAESHDPDGDLLSVLSVSPTSTNGANVAFEAGVVTYTPRAGFMGADRFSYTISDGRGASASAWAIISVVGGEGYSRLVFQNAGGANAFDYFGIPGLPYLLQRSINLKDWTTISSNIAPWNGHLQLLDTNPPDTQGFYRTASP